MQDILFWMCTFTIVSGIYCLFPSKNYRFKRKYLEQHKSIKIYLFNMQQRVTTGNVKSPFQDIKKKTRKCILSSSFLSHQRLLWPLFHPKVREPQNSRKLDIYYQHKKTRTGHPRKRSDRLFCCVLCFCCPFPEKGVRSRRLLFWRVSTLSESDFVLLDFSGLISFVFRKKNLPQSSARQEVIFKESGHQGRPQQSCHGKRTSAECRG